MMAETKTRLRWIRFWLLRVTFWGVPFFFFNGAWLKALWLCMFVVYAGAAWLIYLSDIDTERGLERSTNVFLGLVLFQIAVVALLVIFRSSLAR